MTTFQTTAAGALAALVGILTLASLHADLREARLEEERQQRIEAGAHYRLDLFLHGGTNTLDENDLDHATPEQRAALANIID